ncbi:hypothetical protein K4F52_001457 [Lecanicillium sp. MT-2017a]|nr:hypothetical protein K4F52_001457 [Lecanicillium sp. MT-2017a]
MIFSFISTATVLSAGAAAQGIHHVAGGIEAIPVVDAEPTPIAPRAAVVQRDVTDCIISKFYDIGFPSPTGKILESYYTTGGIGLLPTDPVCSATFPAGDISALSSYYMTYSEFLNTAEDKASSVTDFCGGDGIKFTASVPCRSKFTLVGTGSDNQTATPTSVVLPSITKVLDVTVLAGASSTGGAASRALAAGVGVAVAALLVF